MAGEQIINYLDLGPYRHAAGAVRMPGSKSISNRVLLLAALARGQTHVRRLLEADDTRVMLDALTQLGVVIERRAPDEVRVMGTDGAFPVKQAELFLGNAGTAFRPLTAVLAVSGGEYRLTGVPRMHERPIADLVDALRGMGAAIDYLGNTGFPPLAIHPPRLTGDAVTVRGEVSSQFLSALLMALPLSGTAMRLEVAGELISKPYVDITLRTMRRFGVDVQREGWQSFTLPSGARYISPGEITVEGDASSASYFLAAAAIGGGPVRVEGVGKDSIQGDVLFAEALARMGATIAIGDNWIEASSLPQRLRAFDLDLNHIPDAAMTLAVTALFAEGTSTLRNIASWRVKETDRIGAMATELAKLGATVEAGADYLRVTPPTHLRPATIDTYDDHRMAMCFALASLGGIRVRINDPACVAKTFPDFFSELQGIAS
jgi:3-phosphoshikimate 1-carboxyvinyltransferase